MPPHAATGSITTADPVGGNIVVGDTFVLDDGFGHVLTFELDTGTLIHAGAIPIVFHPDTDPPDTAITIAGKIASSVSRQAGFGITATADVGTSVVVLTNARLSSHGNTDIMSTGGIHTSFTFRNMRGGVAGDCANGIGCASDADCTSNSCNPVTKRCH
jgi:hypothetical protein